MVPTGAGEGTWGEGVRWYTVVVALTRLSVKEIRRRHLLELAMAAGVRE